MRFAIYVGAMENGFDASGGGEVRYAFNVAQALAKHGHTVDCVGSAATYNTYPQWGTCPPVKNINLVNDFQIDRSIEYVAYLNAPWFNRDFDRGTKQARATFLPCTDEDVNAKVHVHFMFSWNKDIESKTGDCWVSHNHIIARPYDMPGYETDKAPLRLIPSPVFDEYVPLNPETRKSLVWACKSVFTDDWGKDEIFHPEGVTLLKAISYVSNKLGVDCHFISSGTFDSARGKRFGVPEIVAGMQNKTMYDGMIPNSELNVLLLNSRVVPILPCYSGSFLDAFPRGAIPAFYSNAGGSLSEFPKFFPDSLGVFELGMSVEDMSNVLERIFTDDDYYTSLINDARSTMNVYSFDSCHDHIMKIVEEFC